MINYLDFLNTGNDIKIFVKFLRTTFSFYFNLLELKKWWWSSTAILFISVKLFYRVYFNMYGNGKIFILIIFNTNFF